MLATAQTGLATAQAQADEPVLQTLSETARPGDVLLMAMPPFGDVQESTTHLMAYLDNDLPTYAWIESEISAAPKFLMVVTVFCRLRIPNWRLPSGEQGGDWAPQAV